MPDEHKFEQQGQNVTGPQTNIAGGVQGPVLSGRFERIQSIITTGNNSPVFLGYERLRDAVIQPGEVFRRVHIESFVGRRWLIDQVDSILNDENNSCGYLVLEAHAGLGKTAFLAWLVKERNYIHHFVELAPGQEGIEKGLKNLAAQIILAYKLSADEAIPDAAGRPDYLYRLLTQAAENRGPGERIVVVVDALDEAGTPPNQNVLGLPKVLPESMFFIVSMRPVQVTLQSDRSITPRWPLKIFAESPENLDDMKSFLQASAAWPKVKQALEKSRYTADDFIDALMKKSGGLWIYLHFVIPEIVRGERSPLDLDKLPEGLQEYYAGYWARWRKTDKWYGLYLPILTTLAAAQEPSTLERILDWAGIVARDDEKLKLKRILKEEWRPFLAISGEGEEEKYRFYHATAREFFEGKAELNSPTATENDLIDELSLATRERHRVIAESYLARWGGLEKGLPDLMNKRKEDGCYGLRHLAAHLEASGQNDELHRLLNLETPQGRNLWYEAKEVGGDTTGYINDVMRAWRLAEEGYDPEDIERTGRLIGLQIRYALIFASINSLSDNIPSDLLLALVENGIWSKEEGLAYARRITDPKDRSVIITELSSLLNEPELLNEALATASEIPFEGLREHVLANIIPKILDTQRALTIARKLNDKRLKVNSLANILYKLQDAQMNDVLDEALATAREIQNRGSRARALAIISPIIQDVQESLAVSREIPFKGLRAITLAKIASNLRHVQMKEVLDEALATAREISHVGLRDRALANIAPNLQESREAIFLAAEIQDEEMRANALAKIASKLKYPQKKEVLDEAISAAFKIQNQRLRESVLANIAPNLQSAEEGLAVSRKIEDEEMRANALAKIASRLQYPQMNMVMDEAISAAHEIYDKRSRARTLSNIAFKLNKAQMLKVLDEALATIREIKDDLLQANALAKIAPYLKDTQEAMSLASKIQNAHLSAGAIVKILPNLQDPHEALGIARKIAYGGMRADALAGIAPNLEDPQEALGVAREITYQGMRVRAFAGIASKLQDAQMRNVLDEALASARRIPYEALRDRAIAIIAYNLQDAQEALEIAREIKDEKGRASTLAKIAPNLQDTQMREVLDEALASARNIQDYWSHNKTLAEIAPNLPVAQEALALAREIKDKRLRVSALANISLNFNGDQKKDVLEEALSEAREIEDEGLCAVAQGEVLSILYAKKNPISLSLWSPIIHSLSNRKRSGLLRDLSPFMLLVARLGGDDALLETIQAIKDVGRWWP